MNKLGEIIRKLRKNMNMTQEELAELINVTPQAISKWENSIGMPDISQLIPLANVFNVSVDTLLGINNNLVNEEINKIVKKVESLKHDNKLIEAFTYLQDNLKFFPSNLVLLQISLELCCALGFNENDCFDKNNEEEYYQTAIRQSNIILKYSDNITDCLRSRFIMVLLHSQHNHFDLAFEHADKFPFRNDMSVYLMYAYIMHNKKNYDAEILNLSTNLMFHMESSIDDIIDIAKAYELKNEPKKAILYYSSVLDFIKFFFKDEELLPPLHVRDRADVYHELAKNYLKVNDQNNAIQYLQMMVDYDVNIRSKFYDYKKPNSIFFNIVKHTFYYKHNLIKQKLLEKVNDINLSSLKDNDSFLDLLKIVNNLDDSY